MKSKKNNGITLIALVITIIVLLILAGVTINLLLRENGIFGTAQNAASEYKKVEIEEQIKLAYNEAMMEYYISGANVRNTFESALRKTYSNATVEGEEEPYTVTINGEVYEVAGNSVAKSVEAKYRPVVTYIIGETADATENMETNGDLEEGTPVYVIVTVSIESGEINSVTAGAGLELDETNTVESEGKYVYKVTKGGKYNLTILSNNETENKYTKKATIAVNGIYKETITVENVEVGAKTTTTHTGKELDYTWDELAIIANAIANNTGITKDTTEITVNGVTIGIGDYTTVKYNNKDYTLGIIGFNHDELSDSETATATGKAGITFGFMRRCIDCGGALGGYGTNDWGDATLKQWLPTCLTTIESENSNLSGKIKEVIKKYVCMDESIETNNGEKLWLFAVSEIFGDVINCNEGEQYKWFALSGVESSQSNSILKRLNYMSSESESGGTTWWLRTLDWTKDWEPYFYYIDNTGKLSSMRAISYR